MRRKSFIVFVFVLVTAVLFSACTPNLSLEPEVVSTPQADQPNQVEEVEVATGLSGQIQIAGSTTVQPLSEKLALAFMAINPNLVIEVQGGGSSVGVTAAGEGTVNLGQVSRAVKDSEFETFPDLKVHTIAFDGIAIVTNPDFELPSITLEQAKLIFGGEITNYAEVGGPNQEIVVVSREEGSGTRAAFDELVLESSEPKFEMTETAILQQSNGQVRTTVATTPFAIGYLSFGFLDESINLVEINGFLPTVDNVLAGNYPVFRPLNLTSDGDPDELSQAFLDFIMSPDGQAIIAEDYIPAGGERAEYVAPTGLTGQIQIAGSTTVQPLSEKLALAFMAMNPELVIEVQGGGSSVGVTAAGEGTVNIGQVSRAIKDSEFETFPDLMVHTIAFDGIAIVTNPDFELPSITLEQAKLIFGGEITNYAEVGGPNQEIIVVSREEGSGTRAAFDELVLESSEPKFEMTETAILQQSNGQVRTTVATTPFAIGYLSFGFLDESISLVEINGFLPTVDNVLAGNYPVFRPLNLTTLGDPDELSQAFLDFINSPDGQAIIAEDYIPAGGEAYVPPTDLTGQIQIAGSTTVQPLSEKLALAFMEYNPGLVIEVQGGGSSVGVTAAGEGTVDIGQVSRAVRTSEFETFPDLMVHTIAYDGIAIVTHPDLQLPSLTLEQAKLIFGGEITNYAEVGGPNADIIVVSREEGSGTRAAFDELVLESSDPKFEMTETAILQQSNGQVRTTVATTPFAIGYLSFGFLDESVNLVEINGFLPTVDNVLSGNYPVFRPLNLTTLGEPEGLAKAFLDFILSSFGQQIVAEDYIRAR